MVCGPVQSTMLSPEPASSNMEPNPPPLYKDPMRRRFTIIGTKEPAYSSLIRDHAMRLGVLGYVRVNLWDDKTEVFVEGESERVEELSTIIRTGSEESPVTVVKEGSEYMQMFRDFRTY